MCKQNISCFRIDFEYFHDKRSNNKEVDDKLTLIEDAMKAMTVKMLGIQNEMVKLATTKDKSSKMEILVQLSN